MTTTARPTKTNIGAAGLKAFFKIAELWGLNVKEQMLLLGLESESTYYSWKRDPGSARVSRDLEDRLSLTLGIYKDLQILLPNTVSADRWIKKENSNPLFGGRTPMDLLASGYLPDIYKVRMHLANAVAR